VATDSLSKIFTDANLIALNINYKGIAIGGGLVNAFY